MRTFMFVAISSTLLASPCVQAIGLSELFSHLKEPFTQGLTFQSIKTATGASLSALWTVGSGIAIATILGNIILPESQKNRLRQCAFWNWFVFKREPLRARDPEAINPLAALELRVAALEALHPAGNHTAIIDRIVALERAATH